MPLEWCWPGRGGPALLWMQLPGEFRHLHAPFECLKLLRKLGRLTFQAYVRRGRIGQRTDQQVFDPEGLFSIKTSQV